MRAFDRLIFARHELPAAFAAVDDRVVAGEIPDGRFQKSSVGILVM
jgi:hypothetical protein